MNKRSYNPKTITIQYYVDQKSMEGLAEFYGLHISTIRKMICLYMEKHKTEIYSMIGQVGGLDCPHVGKRSPYHYNEEDIPENTEYGKMFKYHIL